MAKTVMEFIRSKFSGYDWDLVQYKRVRSVYSLSKNGTPELYVKIYHPDTLLQKLRNLFFPKTLKEMRTLETLRSVGIPVPGVHSHLKQGFVSALVTKALHPSSTLAGVSEEKQATIMLELVRTLLEKRFFYGDCHAGNVVLDGSESTVLVDAYAVKPVKEVTEKLVISQFSQITSSFMVPDEVLRKYIGGLVAQARERGVVRAVQEQGLRSKIRRVRRKVERTLREGSFSRVVETGDYRAFVANGHPVNLDRVIRAHEWNVRDRTGLLKLQHKTQISEVDDVCVKSYARPRPLASPYALRSWKGLLTLLFNGIPVADPVAAVVRRDRTSLLLTRFVREGDLNLVLHREYGVMTPGERMSIAGELGGLVGVMHRYRIHHADLKALNIKIARNPLAFTLLDTDKVTQGRRLSRSRRVRNLMQINTSIPRHVSRSVRMAFIRAYSGLTGDNPKALFRDVWKLSSGEPIIYRTEEGDRIESWLPLSGGDER